MAYITAEDLHLGYDGRPVAENVNFCVNPGDYLCVIGENGAGKSTLVKTILNLMPPISGRLVTGEGLQRDEIGYLPQQTEVQRDFPASVWEIVLSGTLAKCGLRPFYSREEKARATESLMRMNILDLKKSSYRNLSGGQQQRVLLARALCAASRLILLDEPVNGLDPKAAADFYQIIRRLNQEGIAVMMVSHDMESALSYASHILHIQKERSFYGTVAEYKKSDLWKHFLKAGGEQNE